MSISIPDHILNPPKDIDWITVPGVIVTEENTAPPGEIIDYIKKEGSEATFKSNDVFLIGGTAEYSIVQINKLKPTTLMLDIPIKTFREQFFS